MYLYSFNAGLVRCKGLFGPDNYHNVSTDKRTIAGGKILQTVIEIAYVKIGCDFYRK